MPQSVIRSDLGAYSTEITYHSTVGRPASDARTAHAQQICGEKHCFCIKVCCSDPFKIGRSECGFKNVRAGSRAGGLGRARGEGGRLDGCEWLGSWLHLSSLVCTVCLVMRKYSMPPHFMSLTPQTCSEFLIMPEKGVPKCEAIWCVWML